MDQYGEMDDLAAFSAPGKNSLLQCIQQEILDLEYQGKIASLEPASLKQGKAQPQKKPLPGSELKQGAMQSLHIHSCHSVMREVEVLYDQLLAMFDKDKTLMPRDVVVMMPRVAPYVACIHSVFNNNQFDKLPYHISDRSLAEESPLLNSLVTLLRLPESRLPLSEVLALLEVPAIQRRFGLDYDSYNTLKRWLVDAGVRWGLDSEHRKQLGLPEYSESSWEFGFNRLMAGYAMSANNNSRYTNDSIVCLDTGKGQQQYVQPYDNIEGSNSDSFNSLLMFWHMLKKWRLALNTNATPRLWAERLRNMLEDFFDSEGEQEANAIKVARSSFSMLDQAEESRWFTGEITLAVIRDVVQPALQQSAAGQNHWREGIKFCSLMPMRGVPFKVVYIMGMNMEDYPRRIEKRSFDLMRNNHRPGDRASRIDDRWLFLEALLSARQFFHVSYIGRDIFRNEKREPSVVLSELIDYCRHGYDLSPDYLQTEHPLQPFSEKYFRQDKSGLSPQLISFNKEAWYIARAKNATAGKDFPGEQRWPVTALEAPATSDVVALDDFIKFFTKPWDWFFSSKHKVRLKIEDDSINDSENFGDFSALDKWQLRDELITRVNRQAGLITGQAERETLRDQLVEQMAQLHSAEGNWPLGVAGENEKLLLKKMDTDYLWASYDQQMVSQRVTIGAGIHQLAIDCSFPLIQNTSADRTLIVHSASSYKTANQLDFYIRLSLAIKAGLATRGLSSFNDKKGEVISSSAVQGNDHLLAVLAELYLQYRESGLPFEPDLSRKLSQREEADDREEIIEDSWNEEKNNWSRGGIAYDSKKRSYYGHINTLRSDSFLEVSNNLWQAVDAWYAQKS
jgi:exodeoxyribonuclease V gamma subunit